MIEFSLVFATEDSSLSLKHPYGTNTHVHMLPYEVTLEHLPKLLFQKVNHVCSMLHNVGQDTHFLKKELVKLIEVFHTRNDLPLTEGESSSFLNHSRTHRHTADAVVVGECLTNCGAWRGDGKGREER